MYINKKSQGKVKLLCVWFLCLLVVIMLILLSHGTTPPTIVPNITTPILPSLPNHLKTQFNATVNISTTEAGVSCHGNVSWFIDEIKFANETINCVCNALCSTTRGLSARILGEDVSVNITPYVKNDFGTLWGNSSKNTIEVKFLVNEHTILPRSYIEQDSEDTYTCGGNIYDCHNTVDENWETFGVCEKDATCLVFENYTIPANLSGANVTYKQANSIESNIMCYNSTGGWSLVAGEIPDSISDYSLMVPLACLLNSTLQLKATLVSAFWIASSFYEGKVTWFKPHYSCSDVENTGCIIINASDITLNCQNVIVAGTNTSSSKGLFIDNAKNLHIKNCIFESEYFGVEIINMTNSTFENIISRGNKANNFNIGGVQLKEPKNNTFINITSHSAVGLPGAYGMSFTYGVDNTIKNSLIINNVRGLFADETYDLKVIDSIIINNTIADVRFLAGASIEFFNVTHNLSKITFGDCMPEYGYKCNLTSKWYLDINVKDALEQPLQDAIVNITDKYSKQTSYLSTDTLGNIHRQNITEYTANSTTIIYFSNYTITYKKPCYFPDSQSLNLTTNKQINLQEPTTYNLDFTITEFCRWDYSKGVGVGYSLKISPVGTLAIYSPATITADKIIIDGGGKLIVNSGGKLNII